MVLYNPCRNISFRVKKLKFQINNTLNNYLAMKGYILHYKLQYSERNKKEKQNKRIKKRYLKRFS